MKQVIIDNPNTYNFMLWDLEYRYKYNSEDKKYYFENILKLNPKKNNAEKLINIFTNILKKQNQKVDVTKYDVFWLFNFFNFVFL